MNPTEMIGKRIVRKDGKKGTIKSIEGTYVYIELDDETTYKSTLNFIVSGNVRFEDEDIQSEIDRKIEEDEKKSKEAKSLKEESDARRKAERQSESSTTSRSSRTRRSVEDMDPEYHVEKMSRDIVMTYQEVERKYGIRITGFGRGINVRDNSLILISSIRREDGNFTYHDSWLEDGDYVFSGEGKNGNQKNTGGNKEIIDSKTNGKAIHLLVRFSPEEYYDQGLFELKSYELVDDRDENGQIRKEYKFRLTKIA